MPLPGECDYAAGRISAFQLGERSAHHGASRKAPWFFGSDRALSDDFFHGYDCAKLEAAKQWDLFETHERRW